MTDSIYEEENKVTLSTGKDVGASHLIFSMKQKLASVLCPVTRREALKTVEDIWGSNKEEILWYNR